MTFEPADVERLSASLSRLLPHADGTALGLTGGVAIEIHCYEAAMTSGRTRIADIDFVAASVDAIRPSVSSGLLVSHFHLPQPGSPKFMVQLVDPETRLRIDVFPDLVGSISRAVKRTVAGHRLRVLDARSILDHKVLGMSRASAEQPIDAKHPRDAQILGQLCGQHIEPLQPALVGRDIYDRNLTPCLRCNVSGTSAFPVAARERIFEILGYN